MEIKLETTFGLQVQSLLGQHLSNMQAQSPPESVHALDLSALKADNISFWCAWDNSVPIGPGALIGHGVLMGCGALKAINSQHGEIKSMRTADRYLRQGVAAQLLAHILDEARKREYTQVSLETGSMAAFEPARKLYKGFGFVDCAPFDSYEEDPNSCFMCLSL